MDISYKYTLIDSSAESTTKYFYSENKEGNFCNCSFNMIRFC